MKTSPGPTVSARIEWLETRIAPAAAVLDLSTLNGSNGFAINGAAAGDMLGASARGIGDINGDGSSDFVIGVPFADDGATEDTGRLAVIFGRTTGLPAKLSVDQIDGTNGFLVIGEEFRDSAGFSVGAGDVNGDGLADLIIGAPYATGTSSGIVYVVYGQGTFPQTFNLSPVTPGITRIFGEAPNDGAGFTVSSAGDFNHDGKDDVLIGAPAASGPDQIINAGAAYVVFGATRLPNDLNLSTLTPSEGFKVQGEGRDDLLGISVNSAGDFNKDGFDDIVIGAIGADSFGVNSGSAYVIFGTSSIGGPIFTSALNGGNGFRIDGEAAGDEAGSVASGDLNNDSIDDLIVGAPGAGAVYVIYGKAGTFPSVLSLSSVANVTGFKIQGEAAGDAAGASVAAAGDFNGDGLADLVIGAPGLFGIPGAAYILFGPTSGFTDVVNLANLDRAAGIKLQGLATDDATGSAVSGAGDVNGDGFADLIIGAKGADPAGNESGAAYVVYGFDTRVNVGSNGQSIKFTESDGDVVTIKLSQGGLIAEDIVLAPDGTIQSLDLTRFAGPSLIGGHVKPLNISIGVKTTGGDGFTKIGFLNADGVALGKFKLQGDLGRLVAGLNSGGVAAKSISIAGNLGSVGGAGALSKIVGSLGKLNVKGSFLQNSIQVDGKVKSVKISGDYDGDPSVSTTMLEEIAESGFPQLGLTPSGVFLAESIKSMRIGGTMKGGGITTTKDLGIFSVFGDLKNGNLFGGGGIKAVKVMGRVTSDDPNDPVTITARNKLGSLVINGDVENADILAGYNTQEDPVNPDATVGKVLVKGDWIASSLVAGIDDVTNDGFGRNDIVIAGDTTPAISKIASVVIKGIARGTAAAGDHYGITAQQIGKVSIGGELVPLTENADDILVDTTNNDFRVVELTAP